MQAWRVFVQAFHLCPYIVIVMSSHGLSRLCKSKSTYMADEFIVMKSDGR